ncbi:MAG: HAD hydrolase-like protein, partial [Actinomycetes bacterium]
MPTDPSRLDPPADAAALLFDCDGTLIDTLSLYRVCWRQTFGRYGFEMADDWFAEMAGHHVHA